MMTKASRVFFALKSDAIDINDTILWRDKDSVDDFHNNLISCTLIEKQTLPLLSA